MIEQVAFLVLSAITLGGAVGVATARSVFVSALWLILSFVGMAGMYVLLGAGFLAVIQVLIYVGAITILILFAVMLTHNVMSEEGLTNEHWVLGGLVSLVLFGLLTVMAFRADWPLQSAQVVPEPGIVLGVTSELSEEDASELKQIPGVIAGKNAEGAETIEMPGQITALGRAFMTDHLLAFELASVILLVALVGAIVLARS